MSSGTGQQLDEVMESLTLPTVRANSFDSSTSEEWSEETMLQPNQQMSLIHDEISSHPSSPSSSHEVKIAKHIDFANIHRQTPDHYSSFSTCSSTSADTDSCAARARSLTPQRPKNVLRMQIKKPNSCRLPGAEVMAGGQYCFYPPTPSTVATINVETPVRSTPTPGPMPGPMPTCYTYRDQLESTRRRDQGTIWDFPQYGQNATPDSSLLSPLSVLKVSSSQTLSTSVSCESTPTQYQRACRSRRRMLRRAGRSPRQFRFTEQLLELPRWGLEKVSCVPEKAALSTETGYFIGTWQLPTGHGLITIEEDGTVGSTVPHFDLSAKFLGSRAVEFEFPDGKSKKANLSQDGTEIEFEDGVRWLKTPGEAYSQTEQQNLHVEEDRLDRARASNICSIRSNFRDHDNDDGEFVDIPGDVPFCPSIEIEDDLHSDSTDFISTGEELSPRAWRD